MNPIASADMLKNVRPDQIDNRDVSRVPGRGDLRITLTTACNLRCAHCHNEGNIAPWIPDSPRSVQSLEEIEELLDVASNYLVKSVKFTGGDPTAFRLFEPLLDRVSAWRKKYCAIKAWGISTNGVAFLKPKLFEALTNSQLDNICIGVDSIRESELSKPSSSTGVSGAKLFEDFVKPLAVRWPDRKIKLNTVFTGDRERVLEVIAGALEINVDVSVIEVNGVMDEKRNVRDEFMALMNYVAGKYGLTPRRYEPLNEIYLYNDAGNARVKFYQDHCVDRDCGACRNIHMRVSPDGKGWASVPCFLLAQSNMLSMSGNDGRLSDELFGLAIKYNGMGPRWQQGQENDIVGITVNGITVNGSIRR